MLNVLFRDGFAYRRHTDLRQICFTCVTHILSELIHIPMRYHITHILGTGILTRNPSAAPFGLTLGPA